MDPNAESRIVSNLYYPKIVYLEALILFFGANFLYHQNVFRSTNNKLGFLGFVLTNAFTSYHLAEATNVGASRYYAGIYNNTLEI
jgi:hypothetical protein